MVAGDHQREIEPGQINAGFAHNEINALEVAMFRPGHSSFTVNGRRPVVNHKGNGFARSRAFDFGSGRIVPIDGQQPELARSFHSRLPARQTGRSARLNHRAGWRELPVYPGA
jgi:hypothetical protein